MSRTEAAVAVYGTLLVAVAFGAGILFGARTRSPRSPAPGCSAGEGSPCTVDPGEGSDRTSPVLSELTPKLRGYDRPEMTDAGVDRLLAAVFEVTPEEASMMAVDLERQAPPRLTYEPDTSNLIARLFDWFENEQSKDCYWKLIDEVSAYRRALAMVQHPAGGGL